MVQVLVALLTVVLTAAVQPAAKPNFSGQWKMNAAKSDFGALPAPTVLTRTITHAEPELTIEEEQESPIGNQKATRKYKTDGSPSSFESNGATVDSSAAWTDDVLVVNSKVDVVGLTFNDRMSLSSDGKTLTSQVHVTSPMGDIDFTVVFDKQ